MDREKVEIQSDRTLVTGDGQKISFTRYIAGKENVIILAHGFFNNKDVSLFRRLAEDFSRFYDVISFDARGHGKSGGLFSWTMREPGDLEEIIRYAKAQGYRRIGLMGFSLGAAVALITASRNSDVHSVVSVSAPFDFWQIDYHFWEPDMLSDLKLNLGPKGRGKGVRPGNPFRAKIRPLDIVGKIFIPVLFVHGARDWLIKPRHSEKLFERAVEPKRLVIMPGTGHAERIYNTRPEEFLKLCRDWFDQTLSSRSQTSQNISEEDPPCS